MGCPYLVSVMGEVDREGQTLSNCEEVFGLIGEGTEDIS
ncbi:hypothetical protein SBF1_2620005 [Candidatus Desulfosporosinus infrequens]|uniref:Uncharacterized protein n=1 Tax=Candidatus Desulfosporosinus infrequens TaxID=2043169 RepID=A0A2U3KRT3_9FIRM|nr:hypothetical protein SBF1_2620005 [Candidatus Desulfosporosinus infrequens]